MSRNTHAAVPFAAAPPLPVPPPAPAWAMPLSLPSQAPPLPGMGAAPLTAEHLLQLEQANVRAAKLRKAASLALFNGITLAVFAGGAMLCALISLLFGEVDLPAVFMTVGLALAAYVELLGRRMFRRFDPRAPRILGFNQLALMALILIYCAWMLGSALLAPNRYAAELGSYGREMGDILGSMDKLHRLLSLAVYGAVAVGAVIFQGLNALYYFTRAKHLRAYLAETPPWVVEVQRRTAGG